MRSKRRDFLKTIPALSSLGFSRIATAQENPTVKMVTESKEYYFDPIGLHVQPGDTVTFKNVSGSHSTTAYKDGIGPAQTTRIPSGAEGWDSGTLTSQGATFKHTFQTEGTYDYFCIPHKTLGMVARIVVGEPGGPAEGSMPPDGEVPDSGKIIDRGEVTYGEFTSGSSSKEGSSAKTGFTVPKPVQGGGLLSGMAIIAGLVYRYLNSEGERYRVGTAEWKRQQNER